MPDQLAKQSGSAVLFTPPPCTPGSSAARRGESYLSSYSAWHVCVEEMPSTSARIHSPGWDLLMERRAFTGNQALTPRGPTEAASLSVWEVLTSCTAARFIFTEREKRRGLLHISRSIYPLLAGVSATAKGRSSMHIT